MEANNKQNITQVHALGIDLSADYTQISYMAGDMKEPKSISTIPGENKYLIPTLMYKLHNINEWCIGDEAKFRAYEDDNEYHIIGNLLDRLYDHEEICLDETKYTELDLLKIYFEKVLAQAEQLEHIERPEYIAVTVEHGDKEIIDAIYSVLGQLGFGREKISVLGHTESFIYYALSQKKELWVNDVALFDFNNDHFSYRKLSIMRNRQPAIVTVREDDFSRDINMTYLDSERGKQFADEQFLEIIRREFHKQIISSVYLTGIGFYSDFAKDSLVELCSKRRVFKGYNLFVKGACIAAMEKYRGKEVSDYIFQCDGRTRVNIGLMINHDGRNTAIALSKAGTNWYEAGAKAECILDSVKNLQIILSSPYDNCSRNVRIDLSDFPDRPNKTTRVSISLAYVNENQCDVVVEDLGFGDFFKSSGMVVKESIMIDNVVM